MSEIDLSRRALLRGRLRPAARVSGSSGKPVAQVGDTCLVHQGVYCQNCRDACEVRAIRFIPRAGEPIPRPYIDTTSCTGCGDCVSVCPTQAITLAPLAEAV